MAPRTYISVKRELLQWARNTAGFTLEEAARKIGVTPAQPVVDGVLQKGLRTTDRAP